MASEMGYPVVMKVVSPDALHKPMPEVWWWALRILKGVMDNFKLIHDNLLKYKHDARFEGLESRRWPLTVMICLWAANMILLLAR